MGDLLVSGSKTGQGLMISAKDILVHGSGNWILTNFTYINNCFLNFNLIKLIKLIFFSIVEYASKYAFNIQLPHLFVEGRYVVDGRVLFLPITGNGKITANFTNGEGHVRLKGIQKEINGNIHFVVNNLDIKIKVQSGKIELENLFGGDKTLGEIINNVINDNFDTFTLDLLPLIEKSLARIFKNTGNKILKRFTMAQLFP